MPYDSYSHRRDRGSDTKQVNKRRKRDWMTRAVPILSSICWIAGIFALLFFGRARPRSSGYVNVFFGTVVSSWNKQYLYLSLMTASAAFIVSAVALLFNLRRRKRESDQLYKSIPILMGCMGVYMAYVMLRFSNYLF